MRATFHYFLGITLVAGLCLSTHWAFAIEDSKAKSLARYTMGVIHDFNGLTEDAVDQFKKSASYDDKNYAVHLRLGADYARLGKLSEAIKELHLALAQDPQNVQARYLLALIYSTQKDFDKAAAEYESILQSFSEAQPENLEIYGYLGQLYYSQKQYPKAIHQFETILSLDPKNTDVMFLLGSLYLEEGQKDKAIDLFNKILQINPDHDGSLNSLGYLYAEDNTKLDEAQKMVERALIVDPKNGAYLDTLGWVYYKKGDYQSALKYLKEADNLLKDPVIYDHIGDVYFKLNEPDNAKKYWNFSLEMQPNQKQIQNKIHDLERQQASHTQVYNQ
jgi:tetratricopeptide (TPR) repeat protein